MGLTPDDFRKKTGSSEYERFLRSRKYDTSKIERTVEESVKNVNEGEKSFVIYGEPQSGKTDMMIALTAKLIDEGYSSLIMLVQNNVTLEEQNRERFIDSGVNPKPDVFLDALDPDYDLKRKHVVFCTKEKNNLTKLVSRFKNLKNKIILDDEADHATPDGKVNKKDEDPTVINALVTELCNDNSCYIGVTATPARLHLNNTLMTNAKKWVFFEPHDKYYGYRFFFPPKLDIRKDSIDYDLTLLADSKETDTQARDIRRTLFKFFVNGAYINLRNDNEEEKFIMLVHTSHMTPDHAEEKKQLLKIVDILRGEENSKRESYLKEIISLAEKKTEHEHDAKEIVEYVLNNIGRAYICALNNIEKKKIGNTDIVTSKPKHLFTVVVGGNIISRGLTFHNLLAMFFSKSVKGKFQQGTYIQRARMFGARSTQIIDNFNLAVPEDIYRNWWHCFKNYHKQYIACRSGNPVWGDSSGEDFGNAVVPASSIDKSTVSISSGLSGFNIIKVTAEINNLIDKFKNKEISKYKLLESFSQLEDPVLPKYFLDDIEFNNKELEIAIHDPGLFIEDVFKEEGDVNVKEIRRTKGGLFSGGRYKYYSPAVHHFWPLKNKLGFIRLWYSDRTVDRIQVRNLINIKDTYNL